jgi:hypothetical protein
MSKLVLSDIANLQSETTAVQTLNANFEAISAAFEFVLSRNGATPNQMSAPLDMNSQRIINLPTPVDLNDAARLADIQDLTGPPGPVGPQGPPGATGAGTGDMLRSNNLSDVLNTTTARTNLGAQSLAANLTALSGLSGAADKVAVFTGAGAMSLFDAPSFGRSVLATTTAAGARTVLGLTAISTASFGNSSGTVAEGNDTRFTQLSIVIKDSSSNFQASELGTLVRHTSGSTHTWTIPSSFGSVGSIISLRNAVGGGAITISPSGGVTLYKAGGTSSGSVVIANGGLASLLQESSNIWVISGAGVT